MSRCQGLNKIAAQADRRLFRDTFSRSVKNPSRSVISMNSVLPNTATKVAMVTKFHSI
jgi:hypothetical protein